MDVDVIKASAPTVGEPRPSFAAEFQSYWERFPDKAFFFALLAAWFAIFQVFGTASFNFSTTPSLFQWTYNAWNAALMDASQGNLIPFVVAILLWMRRRELAESITGWWWPGLILVGFSALLHVFGYLAQQPRVSLIALVLGAYGFVGLVWGWKTMKVSFFPFALFAFCMPFGTFIEDLTFPLRLLMTKITFFVCHGVLDMPLIRDGTTLTDTTGKINFDVAPGCSGIRSFVALLAVTTIFSVLTFKTYWKRAAIVMMTIPLVVICNVVRLVAIALAWMAIGEKAGLFVHEWFGFVTYMMSVLCLLGIAHLLRDKPVSALA